MRLRLLAGLLATLALLAPWPHVTPPPLAAMMPRGRAAWRHNLGVLERYCAAHDDPWDSLLGGRFRATIQYDDVEAHKACMRARGRGCRNGACAHRLLGRGCLNSRRDRCCDAAHKRCTIILSQESGRTARDRS